MSEPTTSYLPENELIKTALEALIAALGPVEATRFLSLTHTERLESVLRHQQWQETLDQQMLFDDLFTQADEE